jgi:hypothetical protein
LVKEGKNMAQIKGIFALGVILLFMGLAASPVIAETAGDDQMQTTINALQKIKFSQKEMVTIEEFVPILLEKVKTASSYTELTNIISSLTKEYGRSPIIVFLLTLLIKGIDFNFKINQLRPLRRTAFILSWGFTNKFLALGKNKLNIIRPFTAWYYSGKSNLLLNSRTIILDLYPFSIRTLTGRQIGFMADFVGLYSHRTNTLGDKAITFFFGHAQTIRGFDLSPIHN